MTLRIRPAFSTNPVYNTQQLSPEGGAGTGAGRIHGRAIFVGDEDYAVNEDDSFITLESTNGLVHTVDFRTTVARVDGAIVNVTLASLTGSGSFNVLLSGVTIALSSVGDTVWAKWSTALNEWIALNVPPLGGSPITIPQLSAVGPTSADDDDIVFINNSVNDVGFQLPPASEGRRWRIFASSGNNDLIIFRGSPTDTIGSVDTASVTITNFVGEVLAAQNGLSNTQLILIVPNSVLALI